MDTAYWNLFWTTGMPEAWLMSRGWAGTPRPETGSAGERPESSAQPEADPRFDQPGGISAGPGADLK